MKKGKYAAPRKSSPVGCILVLCLLVLAVGAVVYLLPRLQTLPPTIPTTTPTTQPDATTQPPVLWEAGYLAWQEAAVPYTDEAGAPLGTLPRGTQVEYTVTPEGRICIRAGELTGYVEAEPVADPALVIPEATAYVRTALNLRNAEGRLLTAFCEKGARVTVTGCDYVDAEGRPHMYRVRLEGEEGYVPGWYLTDTSEAALENYDHNGNYATHAARPNRYGGGDAATLDYYPREKAPIEGNEMPEEVRALYLVPWVLERVEDYIALADKSGINAFVVDITDGSSVAYAATVMEENCPSGAAAAQLTVQEYAAAVQKLKDAGYYVIGRITTFNDSHFIKDHPEYAIADLEGNPMKLSGAYWPTAFNRSAWQYKVDLAVEAVELMGFHEIQFDYVRFPDSTSRYESAGTIDFRNTYGETKAQAIQRFLMYATDILHEHGAYVSADVYGESAYNYVTAYGQYWAAISNVVDAISGMPYPDHFAANGTWLPWEHPYETLNNWGKNVMTRQGETATPAAVRTWIQAYNAIKEPYNVYGAKEVAAQIKGLRDAGCTGGFMTWNSGASLDKYTKLLPAFEAPKAEEETKSEETKTDP